MTEYRMTGVTHVGKYHAENQDCIVKREISGDAELGPLYLVGVADGISGTPCGGSVARWLMQRQLGLMDGLFVPGRETIAEQLASRLQTLALGFRAEFRGQDDVLESGAAVAVAVAHGGYVECCWAGDVAIYINRAGDRYGGRRVSVPDSGPAGELTRYFGGEVFEPHSGRVLLTAGDILTIASDGANLDEWVLQDVYAKQGCNAASLTCIMNMALRSAWADDVSIVALERL